MCKLCKRNISKENKKEKIIPVIINFMKVEDINRIQDEAEIKKNILRQPHPHSVKLII